MTEVISIKNTTSKDKVLVVRGTTHMALLNSPVRYDEIILEKQPQIVHQITTTNDEDLFRPLHYIIKFGRCIGICPIPWVWNSNFEDVTIKWTSSAVLTNIIICIFLAANSIMCFYDLLKNYKGCSQGQGNVSILAMEAQTPIFYLIGVISYLLFLFRWDKFLQIFSNWRKVSKDLIFTEVDVQSDKHVNQISILILISILIHNILNDIRLFPIFSRTQEQILLEKNFSAMETYYFRNHSCWYKFVPYNFIFVFLLYILHKLSFLAWNYLDLIIIVLSRLLYYKFEALFIKIQNKVLKDLTLIKKLDGGKTTLIWTQVRKDHLNLCKLVDTFEVFLSPMIFASYTMNIYSVCMQLNQGITPADDDTILKSIYSGWSLFHLITRMFFVSLYGSRVNEFAHKITICIQQCPSKDYNKELERLERMLAGGPIALTGMKCFVLTREFLLVIISVCFTFEIVLLQTSGIKGTDE